MSLWSRDQSVEHLKIIKPEPHRSSVDVMKPHYLFLFTSRDIEENKTDHVTDSFSHFKSRK